MTRHVLHTAALLLLVGCAKIEVANDSSEAVEFQVGYFGGEETPRVRTLQPGESDEYSVNVPVGSDPHIIAWGRFVNVDTDFPRGDPASFSITDNAGVAVLTNTTSAQVDTVYFRSVEAIGDESWLFGFGEWGDSFGTMRDGDVLEVEGLPPATDYALRAAGSVRFPFTIAVGEVTAIDL